MADFGDIGRGVGQVAGGVGQVGLGLLRSSGNIIPAVRQGRRLTAERQQAQGQFERQQQALKQQRQDATDRLAIKDLKELHDALPDDDPRKKVVFGRWAKATGFDEIAEIQSLGGQDQKNLMKFMGPVLKAHDEGKAGKSDVMRKLTTFLGTNPSKGAEVKAFREQFEAGAAERDIDVARRLGQLPEDISAQIGAPDIARQLLAQTPEGRKVVGEERQFARQVERINVPIGDGNFQTMILDRTTGEATPATAEGKPIILTEKQVLISEGKKANSLINPFETKLLSELGRGDAERLTELRKTADTAISSKRIIFEGRKLIQQGIFTGAAANVKVAFNKWLQEVGINVGGRKTANTEAYAGAMGLQVGKIIQQFGAGTGLSDADREFAQKIAAGDIKLTEEALTTLLDINDRLATFTIEEFNRQAQDAKQRIEEKDPFRAIEVPEFGASSQGGSAELDAINAEIAELEAKQGR